MRKLRLNLDELVVSSFVPSLGSTAAGTVKAQGYTQDTCDFNLCGGTQPGACDTNVLGCASGGGSCAYGCTNYGHWTCNGYNTCKAPCHISDVTNCQYCTENRTDYSICPDAESLCVCY
jgi:hypothetical protein